MAKRLSQMTLARAAQANNILPINTPLKSRSITAFIHAMGSE
jgi:hypothetical protein